MTLEAHRNFIFLKLISDQSSKLVLPPVFMQKSETAKRGIVRYCGPLSFVSVGEVVIVDKYIDQSIELDGEHLVIAQPSQIIAVES